VIGPLSRERVRVPVREGLRELGKDVGLLAGEGQVPVALLQPAAGFRVAPRHQHQEEEVERGGEAPSVKEGPGHRVRLVEVVGAVHHLLPAEGGAVEEEPGGEGGTLHWRAEHVVIRDQHLLGSPVGYC